MLNMTFNDIDQFAKNKHKTASLNGGDSTCNQYQCRAADYESVEP